METIRRMILGYVADSGRRWTPADLERTVRRHLGVNRRDIRRALRSLVEERLLDYTYLHGCSFVEVSFNRPVRIGRHIVLLPAGMRAASAAADAVIRLTPGAAFGNGRHPTTRLALEGIAFLLHASDWRPPHGSAECLDIGTGSGVLALAALAMGVRRAVGIDIESCSRFEARANARLNGMQKRFEILPTELADVDADFDMILANLRPPTLKAILPHVCRCVRQGGAVVLSGFRTGDEADDLLEDYSREGMSCVWRESENGWQSAVLMTKTTFATARSASASHR